MFSVIITFLQDNIGAVFTLFTNVLSGGIDIIYNGTTLTSVGELVLLSAVVGLAMFGLRWVRSIIPFVN